MMVNHESHLFIETIIFARENGIVILATAHKVNFNSLIDQYLDQLKPIFYNQ